MGSKDEHEADKAMDGTSPGNCFKFLHLSAAENGGAGGVSEECSVDFSFSFLVQNLDDNTFDIILIQDPPHDVELSMNLSREFSLFIPSRGNGTSATDLSHFLLAIFAHFSLQNHQIPFAYSCTSGLLVSTCK